MDIEVKDWKQLGRRIKTLRVVRGLSQEALAEPEYTAAYVSQIEHGKRRASDAALAYFAARLGLSLEQLVSGRDPDQDLRMEIETQRAVSQIHEGRAEEALAQLQETLAAARAVKHDRVERLAETAIGLALFRLGRVDEALASYERVLSGEDTPEALTSAMAGKARCLLAKGEAREAVFVLEGHLAALDRADPPDPGCLVETYAALIPVYFETGMITRAMEVASRGWELAPKVPDAEQRACLYINRAMLLANRGEGREALSSLALAEDLYRHLGWYTEAVKVSLAKSYVLSEEGRYAEAEGLVRSALSEAGESIPKVSHIRSLGNLARFRRVQGFPGEGLALAEEALRIADGGFEGSVGEVYREVGSCALELGDSERAGREWRRALDNFRTTGDNEEAARTAKLLGRHLYSMGDLTGALEVMEQGLSAVEDLE